MLVLYWCSGDEALNDSEGLFSDIDGVYSGNDEEITNNLTYNLKKEICVSTFFSSA